MVVGAATEGAGVEGAGAVVGAVCPAAGVTVVVCCATAFTAISREAANIDFQVRIARILS